MTSRVNPKVLVNEPSDFFFELYLWSITWEWSPSLLSQGLMYKTLDLNEIQLHNSWIS